MVARKKIDKQKELWNLFYISSAILLILLTIVNLQGNIPKKVLGASTSSPSKDLLDEKKYWEEFLSENPTYYDGWNRLSEIQFLTGDSELSLKSLEIARRIDTNH